MNELVTRDASVDPRMRTQVVDDNILTAQLKCLSARHNAAFVVSGDIKH